MSESAVALAAPATGLSGSLTSYLVISALLFLCGLAAILTRRNVLYVLMGVELILNAANLNFVAFNRFGSVSLDGQMFAVFTIILAAAEAAVALAIALNFYNNHTTIDVDHADELRG